MIQFLHATLYTITGLQNGTSYDVYVTAMNDAGPSLASRTLSGTPFTVPDAPQNLRVTAITSASLTFEWYHGNNSKTVSAPSFGTVIDTLQSSTDYTFTIYTQTQSGAVSPTGSSIISRTLDPLCYGRGTRIMCHDGRDRPIQDLKEPKKITHVLRSAIINNPYDCQAFLRLCLIGEKNLSVSLIFRKSGIDN